MHDGSKHIDLLIIPCACERSLGNIAISAARILARRPGVHVLQIAPPYNDEAISEYLRCSDRVIAVDGCQELCVRKVLNELAVDCEFHLLLTDLGLEESGEAAVSEDDLNLAVDGIVAESTRVSDRIPRLPGGCCCSR